MIFLIVPVGLIAIAFASVLIKLCPAPAPIISLYRLAVAAIFYVTLSVTTKSHQPDLTLKDKGLLVASGAFLAIHFATWIASLSLTSVSSSVVLVQTAPIFVVLGSSLFLKERPTPTALLGISITLAGAISISLYDSHATSLSVTGNLLAIGGAIGAAGYLIAGRSVREHIPTVQYVRTVYSIAAVLMLIFVLSLKLPLFGFSSETYILLLAIAIGPQIIGHTSLNWGLKHFSATTISILTLTEPVGASILAWWILDEDLTGAKIISGIIILTGIVLVVKSEPTRTSKQTTLPDTPETI
jgi:drug/metabolite transporter (DMT)-like permease